MIKGNDQKLVADAASFRDPDGRVFRIGDRVLRKLTSEYARSFLEIRGTKLLDILIQSQLLIPFRRIPSPQKDQDQAHWLEVDQINPWVYPYEWTFGQLKDAALLTLDIMRKSLSHDVVLKDATPFNVQFKNGRPMWIDIASFRRYISGEPWVAYRQFCLMFLGPIAVSTFVSDAMRIRLQRDLQVNSINDYSKILPKLRLRALRLWGHIHLQARFENRPSAADVSLRPRISKHRLAALIDDLTRTIESMSLRQSSPWSQYYSNCPSYTDESLNLKRGLVADFLHNTRSKQTLLDIGANTGEFSLMAAKVFDHVIAVDSDPGAMDRLYESTKRDAVRNLTTVVMDFANPSPALGWALEERSSFFERMKPQVVLLLAVIHHLAISAQIPFAKLAELLAFLGSEVIIEWVPESDPQVRLMGEHLIHQKAEYGRDPFLQAFGEHFVLQRTELIAGGRELLYFLRKT